MPRISRKQRFAKCFAIASQIRETNYQLREYDLAATTNLQDGIQQLSAYMAYPSDSFTTNWMVEAHTDKPSLVIYSETNAGHRSRLLGGQASFLQTLEDHCQQALQNAIEDARSELKEVEYYLKSPQNKTPELLARQQQLQAFIAQSSDSS